MVKKTRVLGSEGDAHGVLGVARQWRQQDRQEPGGQHPRPGQHPQVSSATTARTAAKALNDGHTSVGTKALAGSVLTQRPGKRK